MSATPFHPTFGLIARSLRWRRLALAVPSTIAALTIVALAVTVQAQSPRSSLDWVLLVPFCLVMVWECFIVGQLVLGFLVWMSEAAGWSALGMSAAPFPVATTRSRTAIAIPIFEEDPVAVFTRIRVMMDSLVHAGRQTDLAFHVLSDTRSSAVAEAELSAWMAMTKEGSPSPVFYRRRDHNTGRKAGNIADFFERSGEEYELAIVLDADSLMSGDAMLRLIQLMDDHPRVGLIQTVSYAAGRDTLFARIQQFAVRLYAPLALRGLEFWQGNESSYWGHNAIVRVAPFRTHCRLPVLSGQPPFGGEILCHDVVEAALMVRAGWEVRLLPEMDGTWEEMPTNTLDLVARERRWCQGNLQHLRLLALNGLRNGSRIHIGLGVGGYATAALWWLFLLLGAVRIALLPDEGALGILAYGITETGTAAALLFAACVTLILLPRILNLVRAFGDARMRREFGGVGRLLVSSVLEQVFWLLLGPVLSFVSAVAVLETLGRRVVHWDKQNRDDREIGFGEAARFHIGHVVLGLGLSWAALGIGGWYALWMAPVILGLLTSPMLTTVSSRTDLGLLSRRLGLFLTVDDVVTAPELIALRAAEGQRRAGEPIAQT